MAKFSKQAVIAELESQIEGLEQQVLEEEARFTEKVNGYQKELKAWRDQLIAKIKTFDPEEDDWWTSIRNESPPSKPILSNMPGNSIAQRRQEIKRLGMIADETIDLKVKDSLWRFI